MSANLSELLRQLASTFDDRPAIIGEHGALSFADVDRAADRWAAAIGRAGFGRGAHVGLLAGNGPQWIAVAFGVWRAGATLVPISTFVTARELGEILDHADLKMLVLQPHLGSHDYGALLRELSAPPATVVLLSEEAMPALHKKSVTFPVVIPAEAGIQESASPPRLDTGFRRYDGRTRATFRAKPARPPWQTAGAFLGSAAQEPGRSHVDSESIACILYTSGTTARPKGVMLSHRAILATVSPTAERSGLTPSDSLLSTLPLFWVAGLVIRALPTLSAGCALILPETFTPEGVVDLLDRHRPTALHLRPAQIGHVRTHAKFRPDLFAEVRRGNGRVEWFPELASGDARFITGYGMTEMAGYVTALDWRDPPEDRRTGFGAPLPGVEIRIADETGRVCAPGAAGEIRVRGPGLFSGYYKQPPGAGMDGDGFFLTGDLGTIEADGTFRFSGRTKDLLRVKGINVSPAEVEGVLGAHPAVESAFVVGLPPDGLEQEIVALVVPRDAARFDEADLRRHAGEALSHYKRPSRYLVIERAEIPLSGTSKPQRADLARLAEEKS